MFSFLIIKTIDNIGVDVDQQIKNNYCNDIIRINSQKNYFGLMIIIKIFLWYTNYLLR